MLSEFSNIFLKKLSHNFYWKPSMHLTPYDLKFMSFKPPHPALCWPLSNRWNTAPAVIKYFGVPLNPGRRKTGSNSAPLTAGLHLTVGIRMYLSVYKRRLIWPPNRTYHSRVKPFNENIWKSFITLWRLDCAEIVVVLRNTVMATTFSPINIEMKGSKDAFSKISAELRVRISHFVRRCA